MMKAGYWVAAVLAGVALVAVWHFSQSRSVAKAEPVVPPLAAAQPAPSAAVDTPASGEPPPTAAQVDQWIGDTNSADAGRRAEAINALARAPRDQALPVLRRLVTQGDATDRPRALNSLRELALDQGDTDGAIRQAIREVIYHGDDEALATAAQDALDVVEESEMK